MRTHERLRQGREARGWTLQMMAQQTGVRLAVLEAVERGAFGELPAGVYGRHAVRAYATAVGLDAEGVMAEVGPLLPVLADPIDGLARVKGISRRPAVAQPDPDVSAAIGPETRPATPTDWRPLMASAIDGALLTTIALALLYLTALAAATPIADVLAIAAPAVLGIVALIAVTYFVLLGGIRNATVGARLLQIEWLPRDAARVDGRASLRRGWQCALREGSILVEWLVSTEQARQWLRALRPRRV